MIQERYALLALIMIWAMPAVANTTVANIYKCRGANGSVLYSNSPCKGERLSMEERGSVTVVQVTPAPTPSPRLPSPTPTIISPTQAAQTSTPEKDPDQDSIQR